MANSKFEKMTAIINAGNLVALKAEAAAGDYNILNEQGEGLLHRAAYYDRPDMIEFLVKEAGLPVNLADKQGYTPLHEAARAGRTDSVRLLIELGANVYSTIKSGNGALEMARESGSGAESVQLIKAAMNKPHWYKTADDEASRICTKEALGYKLTEIFNFTNRSYLLLSQALDSKNETMVMRSFAELSETTLVQQAEDAFAKLSGVLPDDYTGKLDKPKKPLSGRSLPR